MYWENLYNKKNKVNKPVELDYFQQEKVKEYRQLADDANRWLDLPTVPSRLSSSGISIPGFLHEEQNVRNMQAALGVEEDGDWGPVTEKAFRTTLINQRDGAENAISEIFAAAAAEQERAEKAQPQLAYGTAQVGQYLAAPASVEKPVYLTADGSRTNVPTGTSPKKEQVYLTADGSRTNVPTGTSPKKEQVYLSADGKRTNVPGITASPVSSGSKGSTGTAAYDRTMQTADASRLGGTAKSTLAAPTYNRTALTADVPHGAAAERGNIYNTADGKRTNVAGGARNSGIGRPTAMEKGEPIARLGGAVPQNSSPTDGYQGGPVDETVLSSKTSELLSNVANQMKQTYLTYKVDAEPWSEEWNMQRMKKKELHDNWQKAQWLYWDYLLNHETDEMNADDVYAVSPNLLIDLAVSDGKDSIASHGYNKDNYPHVSVIDNELKQFRDEGALYTYAGSKLNYYTKVSGLEHMCSIYSVDWGNGNVEFVTGPIVSGTIIKNEKKNTETPNVIMPFAASIIGAKNYTAEMEKIFRGAKVEYEGIIHSHPSYVTANGEYDNHGRFSHGDGIAALLAGKISLTTRKGTMYVLNRDEALEVIASGLEAEIADFLHRIGVGEEKNIDWESIIEDSKDFREGRNYGTLPYYAFDARD